MRRTIAATVVVLATTLAVAMSAAAGSRLQATGNSEGVWVNTTACAGFVSPQPYEQNFDNNFKLAGDWRYSYTDQGTGALVDVRGDLGGVGVDQVTGASYSLSGKFQASTISGYDILGVGRFKLRRDDGARMEFTATFNAQGYGGPELYGPSDVSCFPAKRKG